MSPHSPTVWKFTILPLLLSTIAGCASSATERRVQPGDRVGVNFTCRLKDGALAASSYSEINNSLQPKSALFSQKNNGDAVVIEAGGEQASFSAAKRKSFEEEILSRLSGVVLGMEQGSETTREITAQRYASLRPEEQFVKIARVRKQPKELKMALARFRLLTRMEPAVGAVYTVDPALPGKVVGISGDEVLIRFAPSAPEVQLPFGKGVIVEKEDHWEIDIQAVPGTLVRTGGLAGRISQVDADSITLDYGLPFAGEALECDLKVESVQPGKPKPKPAAAAAKPASPTVNPLPAPAAPDKVPGSAAAPASYAVHQGDLVTVNFTAAQEDGAIFSTTLEAVAKDPALKKVPWIGNPPSYAPREIVAGRDELLPGIGVAVLGLEAGARKQLKLTPEQAFGQPDPKKMRQLPCARTFPRSIRISAADYAKRLSSFPVLNKEVDLVPYFKARVTEVTEHDVALEFQVQDGASFEDSYGTVKVTVAGDQITTTLKPLIGAQFPVQDGSGVISATDGAFFTVDTNNPLAGKGIVIDLEVVKIEPAATAPASPEAKLAGALR